MAWLTPGPLSFLLLYVQSWFAEWPETGVRGKWTGGRSVRKTLRQLIHLLVATKTLLAEDSIPLLTARTTTE